MRTKMIALYYFGVKNQYNNISKLGGGGGDVSTFTCGCGRGVQLKVKCP